MNNKHYETPGAEDSGTPVEVPMHEKAEVRQALEDAVINIDKARKELQRRAYDIQHGSAISLDEKSIDRYCESATKHGKDIDKDAPAMEQRIAAVRGAQTALIETAGVLADLMHASKPSSFMEVMDLRDAAVRKVDALEAAEKDAKFKALGLSETRRIRKSPEDAAEFVEMLENILSKGREVHQRENETITPKYKGVVEGLLKAFREDDLETYSRLRDEWQGLNSENARRNGLSLR